MSLCENEELSYIKKILKKLEDTFGEDIGINTTKD